MLRLIIRFRIRKRREVTSIQNELPCRKRGHLLPLAYRIFRSSRGNEALMFFQSLRASLGSEPRYLGSYNLDFALRNRPGVTSINVGSNPASPIQTGE